jgi:polynucleotide 5'-hydroxyl-kinase GRC3/NOL9
MAWAFHIPEPWLAVSEAVAETGGPVLILGGVDSGKTTFCTWLAQELLARGLRVGLVDADVGQSNVGPPGTIGLVVLQEPFEALRDLTPTALAFVGAVAPEGRLLEMVLGLQEMVARAEREIAEVTLIDTTGFIHGPVARALKSSKIRAIAPRHCVALGGGEALRSLLRGYEHLVDLTVHWLPVSPQVQARSREARRQAREEAFQAYFEGAGEVELDLEQVLLTGFHCRSGQPLPGSLRSYWQDLVPAHVFYAERTPEGLTLVLDRLLAPDERRTLEEESGERPFLIDASLFEGLLVGLHDGRREFLALGLIEQWHFQRGRIRLRSPLPAASAVREVRAGGVRLNLDGTEKGRVRPGEV